MKENFFIWSGRRDSNSRLRHKLHFGFALQPQRLIERLFVPFPKNLAVFWESPQMSLLENKKIAFSTNAISKLERKTRFELATFALARQRSTTEPLSHIYRPVVRMKRLELPCRRHRILSPARLPIPPHPPVNRFGDPSENRTRDTMIKSHVLYRLS